MRIDSVTAYRKRWQTNGWRKEDGTEVANVEIITSLSTALDHRWIGFKKVNGYPGGQESRCTGITRHD
jgi:ribonuclease HI